MYHCIEIGQFYQMTHCFLWRDLELDTFAEQVVNFRDRPSATIAVMALRKTAERFKTLYKEASETIFKGYMDDIADSKYSM